MTDQGGPETPSTEEGRTHALYFHSEDCNAYLPLGAETIEDVLDCNCGQLRGILAIERESRAVPAGDAALREPCAYCGSVNGETPRSAYAVDPLTGEALRAAIGRTTPLINPRLSEVDWDVVAASFALPASTTGDDAVRLETLERRVTVDGQTWDRIVRLMNAVGWQVASWSGSTSRSIGEIHDEMVEAYLDVRVPPADAGPMHFRDTGATSTPATDGSADGSADETAVEGGHTCPVDDDGSGACANCHHPFASHVGVDWCNGWASSVPGTGDAR